MNLSFFRLGGFSMLGLTSKVDSTCATMLAMVSTTLTGYLPTEVSPESITASAPSQTELATSLTSALVGLWLSIMVSIICVAIIHGFAFKWHLDTIIFCTIGTEE